MGKRVTLDRVLKTAVVGNVFLNQDSEEAFESHIAHDEPTLEFGKFSLLGNVAVHYRVNNKTETDDDVYSEFSLFATKEFAEQIAEYGLGNFERDYTNQDGYYEIDEQEKAQLLQDIADMKEFIAETNFETEYLIITFM